MKTLRILSLIFGLVILTNAQDTVLTGTVYDESGSVVPGITIILKTQKSNVYQTETDGEGVYQLELPPAVYSIETISTVGFNKFRLKKYRVTLSTKGKQILDIGLTLRKEKFKCPKGQICL